MSDLLTPEELNQRIHCLSTPGWWSMNYVNDVRTHIAALTAELAEAKREREEARDEVARLREALEKAPHANECDCIQHFVHVEPCPFWTKSYCLKEFGEGECHPPDCNCWKSLALKPQPTEAPPEANNAEAR